ncbi:MAG: Chitinase A1 [Chlamydiae bacterium]|nr:Chitinase A1 [Chlamydiota bacterium]
MRKIFLWIFTFCSMNGLCVYNIGGYFENWAQYQAGYNGQYATKPEDLDAYINGLDTFYYAFSFFKFGYEENSPQPWVDNKTYYTVHNNWNIYPSEWNDINYWHKTEGQWDKALALRNTHPGLKVVLSIGGWFFATPGIWYSDTTLTYFHDMSTNSANRTEFIASAVALCTGNYVWAGTTQTDINFDGIDLDWEYPASTQHGGNGADYQGYYDLLKELGAALHAQGKVLSIAAPASVPAGTVSGTYTPDVGPPKNVDPNIPATYFEWLADCAKHLDHINVMCYDYYGPGYSAVTADNAPLYPFQGLLSTQQTISEYKTAFAAVGGDLSKIIIGLAAYGHTFAGVDFNTGWDLNNYPYGPGANYSGADAGGPLTNQAGYLSYIEIEKSIPPPSILNQSSVTGKLPANPNNRTFGDYFPHQNNNIIVNKGASDSYYYNGFKYDADTGCYYAYNSTNNVWVSFDTPKNASFLNAGQPSSIEVKCNYVKAQGLGGVMIWPLDNDLYTSPDESILKTMVDTMQ